ncbi:uncharacterized protein BX663DRAFT_566612 [Cokeromyces recurvatus]|uniref:uncharacterized protein n=1 Tax=Cokeromyces recurvatus TaxID=90255 RepID=UPI00222044B3|nr:uncharacterized protein BX663DRAFT_566612 [Cokeromyces recurvatus]KAI7908012.1 hypothetical protein BX663DRAFT_566612 [Cokeromyces recurvatus]
MDPTVNTDPPFTSLLNPSNSNLEMKVVHIKLWCHTRADGACLSDISKVPNISVEDHLDQIADLYGGTKNLYGTKFTGRQNTQYIEVYPKTEIKNDFLSNGVLYEKFNIRLLPFGPTDVILDNLRTTLERHDKVLDVSLNYDTRKSWFLSSGRMVNIVILHFLICRHGVDTVTVMVIPNTNVKKVLDCTLCYSCDRYGHKSADCDNPKSKTATTIENDNMSTSDECYIPGDEDEEDSDAFMDYVSNDIQFQAQQTFWTPTLWGGFNYDLEWDIISSKGLYETSKDWITFLNDLFINAMLYNSLNTIPIFQRSHRVLSTIDYIYYGSSLHKLITNTSIDFINPQWPDHTFLYTQPQPAG